MRGVIQLVGKLAVPVQVVPHAYMVIVGHCHHQRHLDAHVQANDGVSVDAARHHGLEVVLGVRQDVDVGQRKHPKAGRAGIGNELLLIR